MHGVCPYLLTTTRFGFLSLLMWKPAASDANGQRWWSRRRRFRPSRRYSPACNRRAKELGRRRCTSNPFDAEATAASSSVGSASVVSSQREKKPFRPAPPMDIHRGDERLAIDRLVPRASGRMRPSPRRIFRRRCAARSSLSSITPRPLALRNQRIVGWVRFDLPQRMSALSHARRSSPRPGIEQHDRQLIAFVGRQGCVDQVRLISLSCRLCRSRDS